MSYPTFRSAALLAALAVVGLAGRAAAQDSTPPKAKHAPSQRVARGRALFHGAGGCAECHGTNGVGTADGPSLTAGPWTKADGTLPSLIHMTRHAGWGSRGREGDPQAMRGPTTLDSAQVRLVADYVFSISRGKTREPRPR
jgi:mono/diheme cytochrome c family protein